MMEVLCGEYLHQLGFKQGIKTMAEKDRHNKRFNKRWRLKIVIRSSPNGPIIIEEIVRDSDLWDLYTEMWREGCLRKGYMEVSISDLTYYLEPIFENDSNISDNQVCKGFTIEITNPGNDLKRKEFSVYSLDLVALRILRGMVKTKNRKKENQLYYNVIAYLQKESCEYEQNAYDGNAKCFRVKVKESKPLNYVRLSLESLFAQAGYKKIEDDAYPVFYTNTAFEKAEKIARKGAYINPSVETGALLIGVLGSCPKTKEFYAIIKDVFEFSEADQSMYSLTPSSRTWKCVQDYIGALRQHSETCLYKILGQCHGHNFIPEISKDSDNKCVVSSVFVSMDDRLWNNAVFNREPCQLCHIFGFDQNGDKVDSLFGLKDGHLLQRGYYLLSEFDLKSHY
jgi:hypothetical protein